MAEALTDLARLVAAGSWPPVVLIEGDDAHARSAAVESVLALVPEADRSLAIDRFDEGPLVRALDAARTPSLLGGHRVVLVYQPAELAKGASKEMQQRLLDYIGAPSERATLVLIAEKVDKRRSVIRALARAGLTVSCERPRERDMPQMVQRLAAQHGLDLDGWAAQAIADAVGTETALAAREVEKIVAACGGEMPDRATVEELLRPGRSVGAFALEDALLEGKTNRAVGLLDRLLTGGMSKEPLAVLGRLAGICRRLAVAGHVVAKGEGESGLQRALGCHPFVATKYYRAARIVGRSAPRGLAECVAADVALKSGGDARHSLMRIVLSLRPKRAGKRARHAS